MLVSVGTSARIKACSALIGATGVRFLAGPFPPNGKYRSPTGKKNPTRSASRGGGRSAIALSWRLLKRSSTGTKPRGSGCSIASGSEFTQDGHQTHDRSTATSREMHPNDVIGLTSIRGLCYCLSTSFSLIVFLIRDGGSDENTAWSGSGGGIGRRLCPAGSGWAGWRSRPVCAGDPLLSVRSSAIHTGQSASFECRRDVG